jgi:tubulin beta
MSQIVNIQLGQCGNSIGSKFIEVIASEHGISKEGKYVGTDDLQRQRVDVFFKEVAADRYCARTILADLDSTSIDVARSQPMGELFDPSRFVAGMGSSGNNWAAGYRGKGAELIDELMDSVRKEAD